MLCKLKLVDSFVKLFRGGMLGEEKQVENNIPESYEERKLIFDDRIKNPGKLLVIGATIMGMPHLDHVRWSLEDPRYIGISFEDFYSDFYLDETGKKRRLVKKYWPDDVDIRIPQIYSEDYVNKLTELFKEHKFDKIIFDAGIIQWLFPSNDIKKSEEDRAKFMYDLYKNLLSINGYLMYVKGENISQSKLRTLIQQGNFENYYMESPIENHLWSKSTSLSGKNMWVKIKKIKFVDRSYSDDEYDDDDEEYYNQLADEHDEQLQQTYEY